MKKRELKKLLAIANDEIASMQNELADKDAIIAEQKRHVEELEEAGRSNVGYYKGEPIIIHWQGEKFYHLSRYTEFAKDTLCLYPRAPDDRPLR